VANLEKAALRSAVIVTLVGAGVLWAPSFPAHAQAPAAASSQAGPAGNAESGKKFYFERGCWQCHGLAAQGGGIAGPRLAGRTPAWMAFSRYVRRPTGEMIPYTEKVISDTELADIFAWLRAIPPPPPVSSIPLFKSK
jgi:ubiquinol-cytochrome c reductase cytochrome c subunit